MKVTTAISQIAILSLKPYEKNARKHPEHQITQLADSINEWGFTIPLLIDGEKNVLAGHGRLLAAKSIGMTKIPCIVAEGWTPEQKKAYIIADNKLSENAEWDMGVYYSELKSLSETGFDLSLLGEADLSNLNFEPETNPQVLGGEVSDKKIEAAQNRLKNQFEDSAKDYREVICPNCGEEFQIDGY